MYGSMTAAALLQNQRTYRVVINDAFHIVKELVNLHCIPPPDKWWLSRPLEFLLWPSRLRSPVRVHSILDALEIKIK